MGIKKVGFIVFLTLTSSGLFGQNIFSSLNLTEDKGDKLFNNFAYKEAISVYSQILSKDEANNGLKLKIAESYRMLNDNKNAEKWYSQVVQYDNLLMPEHKLHYAQALAANMKYDSARYWYLEYQKENALDGRPVKNINSIENIERYFADSSFTVIKNISLNSPMSDFGPAWYKQGIVFVSARENNKAIRRVFKRDDTNFLDLYYSEKTEDGAHLTPVVFHKSINTKLHEGPSIYFDNYSKLIFTGNSPKPSNEGVTGLSLYKSSSTDGINWTDPISLNLNNKEYSVGHPALTSDTETLFFSSNMPGGKGGVDIFKSEWTDGKWGDPVNIEQINTEGDEMFPFIFSDSILYYTSNGSGGLGGLDIYSYNLNTQSTPKNAGYPLNSNGDDFGIIIANDGVSGYLASNRAGGKGNDDIYYFSRIQADLSIYIVDATTSDKVDGVLIQGKEGTISLNDKLSDINGKANFALYPGKNYVLQMVKSGYYPLKILIPSEEIELEMNLDVLISPIPEGTDQKLDSLVTVFLDGDLIEDNEFFSEENSYKIDQGSLNSISALTTLDQEQEEENEKEKEKENENEKEEENENEKEKEKEKENENENENEKEKEKEIGQEQNEADQNESQSISIYEIGNTRQVFFKLNNSFYVLHEGSMISTQNENESLPITVDPTTYSQTLDQYLLQNDFVTDYFKVNDILFDFDKDDIQDSAQSNLDNLINILIDHPDLNVEISGHTDSRGSSIYNDRLSKRRVENTLSYLLGKGLDKERVQLKYFGESQLSNGCNDSKQCTELEHQLNRRVEVRIVFK